MAFQVSPGINVSEVDLTAGAQTVSVSDAAFAGPFVWGPALDAINIASEDDLVRVFGKPDADNYEYWFSAAAFLAYSDKLHVVRALDDAALNATTGARTVANAVVATLGGANTNWVVSNGTFTAVAGQTLTIDGETFIVATSSNGTSFDTTTAPTALALGAFTANSSVVNGIILTANTTAGLANGTTVVFGASGNATQHLITSVINTSAFTINTAVTPANSSVWQTGRSLKTVTHYGTLIQNATAYDQSFASLTNFGPWVAKWAGDRGNSLKVSVCASAAAFASNTLSGSLALTTGNTEVTGNASSLFTTELYAGDLLRVGSEEYQIASITNNAHLVLSTAALSTSNTISGAWQRKWEYNSQFDGAPGTSQFVSDLSGANDELHIVVVDEDGEFTGVPGTVLERYAFVSKAANAKDQNGEANYYATRVNRLSKYVWWLDAPTTNTTSWGADAQSTTFGSALLPETESFVGGQADATNITDADIETAYDFFQNADTIDISLLIAGPASNVVASYLIQNIAEVRKDCVVFCSPNYSDVVNNVDNEVDAITAFRNALPSSSYGILDSGWKYTYDKYNDVYRWVPLNGDIAGIAARTDTNTDPWYSPAGFVRGTVKNVIKLAWNPKLADRDSLYKIGVNSVVSFPQQGVVLYGDKTLLSRPSAFDRINVRRLFIILGSDHAV
jgi:Phage tail sheath protein subtilisin-like domain